MGQAKRGYEEALTRGFHDIGDKFVCEACFGDDAIKEFIRQHAEPSRCDYCGRDSEDSDINGAPIDKVMAVIIEGVEEEWADPTADGVSWILSEGGWQSPVYETRELFADHIKYELEIDEGDLLDDIIESIGDRQWCQKDHLRFPPGQAMSHGWKRFSDLVKYETRYMFFDCPDADVPYESPDDIPPANILKMIGKSVRDTELIQTMPEGRRFFRARKHEASIVCETACELGPPPRECTSSNRMSATGIPMFYGANDAETAIAEIGGGEAGKVVTVGAFDTVKALTVLDLRNMPTSPSLFDRKRRHLRGLWRFLRNFRTDLSRPVERDEKEHVEYVPTQIVTEYFRHQFHTTDGQRVHGIFYPSSKCEGGVCCVLFCSQENCMEKPQDYCRETDQWLRLVGTGDNSGILQGNRRTKLMSNQMKQWLSDDAERLFRKIAQEEDKGHQNTRDLTREFLGHLGFPSADAVRNAADEISSFAPDGEPWANSLCLMRVEDGKLICGPYVVRAWHDYEKFRMD